MAIHTLQDLTPNMERALIRCATLTVPCDRTQGGPISSIHPATVKALERHELIEQARDKRARPCWKPTARGRALLTVDQPRFLHRRVHRGYTTEPQFAIPGEPEAVDATTQDWITARADRDHEQWAAIEKARREQLELDERLRMAIESARLAGVDVGRQELSILRRIESLESKVRRLAA